MTASWACNYLQNAAATTYKKFLQFYAKRSCKKHMYSLVFLQNTLSLDISIFLYQNSFNQNKSAIPLKNHICWNLHSFKLRCNIGNNQVIGMFISCIVLYRYFTRSFPSVFSFLIYYYFNHNFSLPRSLSPVPFHSFSSNVFLLVFAILAAT